MLPRALLAACACLALTAPGCGRDERVPAAPPGPGGTARWSAALAEGSPGALAVDLKTDVACHARLLLHGTEKEPVLVNERPMLAGETARFWWRAEGRRADEGNQPVSLADHQAGRTEAWMVHLTFGWQDATAQWRYPIVGTRPGRGRVLGRVDAMLPVVTNPLPYDTDVELSAVGIADGGPADLALVPGPRGARTRGTVDADAGDRVAVVRLVLRMDRERP